MPGSSCEKAGVDVAWTVGKTPEGLSDWAAQLYLVSLGLANLPHFQDHCYLVATDSAELAGRSRKRGAGWMVVVARSSWGRERRAPSC